MSKAYSSWLGEIWRVDSLGLGSDSSSRQYWWTTCLARSGVAGRAALSPTCYSQKILKPKPLRSGNSSLFQLVDTKLRASDHQIFNLSCTSEYLSPPLFDTDELDNIARACLATTSNDVLCLMIHNDYFYGRRRSSRVPTPGAAAGASTIPTAVDICLWPTLKALHWLWVVKETENVTRIHSRVKDNIKVHHNLPTDYEAALQVLDACVASFKNMCATILCDRYKTVVEKWKYLPKHYDASWGEMHRKDWLVWCFKKLTARDYRTPPWYVVITELVFFLNHNEQAKLSLDANITF